MRYLTALVLSIFLTAAQATIWGTRGDFDGNGTVTAADYAKFLPCLGSSTYECQFADLDGNGTVTATDFALFRALLGNTVTWQTYGGTTYSELHCDPTVGCTANDASYVNGSVSAGYPCQPIAYGPYGAIAPTPTSYPVLWGYADYFWGVLIPLTLPPQYAWCWHG